MFLSVVVAVVPPAKLAETVCLCCLLVAVDAAVDVLDGDFGERDNKNVVMPMLMLRLVAMVSTSWTEQPIRRRRRPPLCPACTLSNS